MKNVSYFLRDILWGLSNEQQTAVCNKWVELMDDNGASLLAFLGLSDNLLVLVVD